MLQLQGFREFWAKRHLEMKPVLRLAAFFLVVMVLLALHRHLTLYASYDQGIFNQLFWNGIHGKFFQSSLSSVLSGAVVIAPPTASSDSMTTSGMMATTITIGASTVLTPPIPRPCSQFHSPVNQV